MGVVEGDDRMGGIIISSGTGIGRQRLVGDWRMPAGPLSLLGHYWCCQLILQSTVQSNGDRSRRRARSRDSPLYNELFGARSTTTYKYTDDRN